jgi:ribosomal protein S18 acetylase RimI-like enzyme
MNQSQDTRQATHLYTCRTATAADVPFVLPMVRAICDLHQQSDAQRFRVRDDVLDRYASWLPVRASDARSVFLVAERGDGSLAGFTVGTIEPEVPIFWVPECGWMHDLWVQPSDRRQGVAQQLTKMLLARFAVLGVDQVRLHTGAFNDSARTMFATMGFRPCVVEMLHSFSTKKR